jgi:Zn-dependent protease
MPVEVGLGLVWYAVFVASTVCHEAAHAFVALRLGDTTAHDAGLATLDPIPHVQRSPIGMVVVPIVSFLVSLPTAWMIGWASTPYDPYWAQRNRRKAAVMALAGPAANFALIILAAILIRLGMLLGLFVAPETVTWTRITAAASPGPAAGAAVVISILFSLNLILMVFNLLPVPPLDGSEVLPLVLDESKARHYREFMAQPAASIIGLVVAWNIIDFVLGPMQLVALNLLYPGAGYH